MLTDKCPPPPFHCKTSFVSVIPSRISSWLLIQSLWSVALFPSPPHFCHLQYCKQHKLGWGLGTRLPVYCVCCITMWLTKSAFIECSTKSLFQPFFSTCANSVGTQLKIVQYPGVIENTALLNPKGDICVWPVRDKEEDGWEYKGRITNYSKSPWPIQVIYMWPPLKLFRPHIMSLGVEA